MIGATIIGMRQLRVNALQATIASRQADVSNRQADILQHQVEVERAKLRADLFDRRLAVYKACKAYIREAMSLRTDFDISFEVASELAAQLEQAEFLFAGDVRDRLRKAADEADSLLTEREKLRDLRKQAARTPPASSKSEKDAQAIAVGERMKKLRENLSGLSEAMGDEMKLYIPRAKLSEPIPAVPLQS